MRFRNATTVIAATVLLSAAAVCRAQNPPPADSPKTKVDQIEQTSRVTVEVSGGEKDVPVENASVYVKYIEERKVRKDKTLEMNVKTNRDGAAHIPNAPYGRVLIQVVAEGWKTYGRWHDITEAKQTFKVHLDKPPKWY